MHELLKMKGISKFFPGVKALEDVDLELEAGEVLALLGENGAGKSTLLKILSGVYIPDAGDIYINGEKKVFRTPADASAEGIGIIYQELNFYDELSVAENIFVGKMPRKSRFAVNWTSANQRATEILRRLNLDIDPATPVKKLSTAQKQLIEIARALASDIRILIMDEPTSALNDTEVKALLTLVKELSHQGIAVIYISHKLEELYEVASRVQVMRDGRRVGMCKLSETNQSDLVKMMVGREIKDMYPKDTIARGSVVMEVRGLRNGTLRDISFCVHAGEILGVFGLMGAGRTEMCKAIFGASKLSAGEILMDGRKIHIRCVADAKRAGIAYLPNDRKMEGLILSQNLRDNFSSAQLNRFTHVRGVLVDNQGIDENAEKWVKKLSVSTPSIYTNVESLSGGNQQKVVIGKWLETNPKVIIMNDPTRGIDVGAKVEIYKLMEDLCRHGMAIILVSSEQAEILSLTDRTIVLCEGRKTGEMNREEYSPEALMLYAIGGTNA